MAAPVSQSRSVEIADKNTSDEIDRIWNAVRAAAAPIGSIFLWCGITAPSGYMLCRGDFLRVAHYPELFAAIGFKWGSSVDQTMFKLPDFQRFIPVGADDANSKVYSVGNENSFFTAGAALPATKAVNFIIKV